MSLTPQIPPRERTKQVTGLFRNTWKSFFDRRQTVGSLQHGSIWVSRLAWSVDDCRTKRYCGRTARMPNALERVRD